MDFDELSVPGGAPSLVNFVKAFAAAGVINRIVAIFATDINGLAASTALYFGRDVLRRTDGSLTPVQWKGFDKTLARYQGEIIDKPILQKRFAAKVQEARAHPEAAASTDWAPMKSVLDAIRRAVSALGPLEDVSGDGGPSLGEN